MLTFGLNLSSCTAPPSLSQGEPMGRKKRAAGPEAPAARANGKPVTLAGAVEAALSALGPEAETPAVRQWITSNYPTIDVSAPSFQSTLSVKRKKARGGAVNKERGGQGARRKAATGAQRGAGAAAEPTLSDLLRAKEAADAQGGV